MNNTFATLFSQLTGHSEPRPWQAKLAASTDCRSQLIRIATGLGKTEGVLSAWIYNLINSSTQSWPLRLVWCLPMRILVEQTRDAAQSLVDQMPNENRPSVHVAMGGEDAGQWFLYPERPAIIIGTQDMLLSRSLNRGYGSSRARWPVEFGLLNHDALWVMDEVQLMDVGLATSAQLQAFRDQDQGKQIKPCFTWWMSATLQADWLKSIDTQFAHEQWRRNPIVVPTDQRTGGLFDIKKTMNLESFDTAPKDNKDFAAFILTKHEAIAANDFGRITLVVCNTVDRACQTYDELVAAERTQGIELVHSRFRPSERESWRARFLSKETCTPDTDRIIVATQVVEAGVDISAGCLITELAPWPNLVQRFGRCARYGGAGKVFVADRGRDEKSSPPYSVDELEAAWESLQEINDVGIASLENYEESLTANGRARLYPYQPQHLLMRHEFEELFDTTPDLTGADLDISRFIRSGDERDLQVFWDDLEKDQIPSDQRQAQSSELCSVPFLKARDWLCGEETKTNRKPRLLKRMRAWVWDWIDGNWKEATRNSLLPGKIVCVAAHCGGYSIKRGFDSNSNSTVSIVPQLPIPEIIREANESDRQQDNESLSLNQWKTIPFHCLEVVNATDEISASLKLNESESKILRLAAHWHDVGKAHPAFQNMLRMGHKDNESFRGVLLAKSDDNSKRRPRYFAGDNRRDERCGFRHELASALALFSILEYYQPTHSALLGDWSEISELLPARSSGMVLSSNAPIPAYIQPILDCTADEFDLLVYLIAAHHGKVRVSLHASPRDQDYQNYDGRGLPIRGIREGDRLPPFALTGENAAIPELALTLEPTALGLSSRTGRSWRERTNALIQRHSPTALAFLESILRAADVRASQLTTYDPILLEEAIHDT